MAFYFLLVDPATGRVAKRGHNGPTVSDSHLMGFRVPKSIWSRNPAGTMLNPADLTPDDRRRWFWTRDLVQDRARSAPDQSKLLGEMPA